MIYYTIEKHNGLWTVWKNIEDHGMGFIGIYTPLDKNTKKACLEWCKEKGLKIGKYTKSNSAKNKRTKDKV